MKLRCRLCKRTFRGRKDKKFCSIQCKNDYHTQLRKATKEATKSTDKILHRNRSIILEIMGNRSKKKEIPTEVLANKNFKFNYHTGTYENAKGKRYHIIYDFAWMEFSRGKVLIIRRDTIG